MRRVQIELNEEIRKELEGIVKNDHRYRVRKRAQAILYKSQEYKTVEIAKILEVRAETVYGWFAKYKEQGVESLYDKKGKGRKAILKDEYKEQIKELALNGVSVPSINAKVKEVLNINVHDETLRHYLKKTKL
jgi:transposase